MTDHHALLYRHFLHGEPVGDGFDRFTNLSHRSQRMSDQTYHLPQAGRLGDPYWVWIWVIDRSSGATLQKVEEYDVDAGWVEFQAWDEETGGYAPKREERQLKVELHPGAPAEAKAWFQIPAGKRGDRA